MYDCPEFADHLKLAVSAWALPFAEMGAGGLGTVKVVNVKSSSKEDA